MNSSDPRTVSAMVRREQARGRLRAATASAGVLGLAVAGGLAFTLPSSAHSTASGSGTKSATSTSGSSSSNTASGSSGSSSSSGIQSSSSAPSSSSGSASATSGGS